MCLYAQLISPLLLKMLDFEHKLSEAHFDILLLQKIQGCSFILRPFCDKSPVLLCERSTLCNQKFFIFIFRRAERSEKDKEKEKEREKRRKRDEESRGLSFSIDCCIFGLGPPKLAMYLGAPNVGLSKHEFLKISPVRECQEIGKCPDRLLWSDPLIHHRPVLRGSAQSPEDPLCECLKLSV